MTVRSTRFSGPGIVSTGTTDLFTVPTGHVYLVRHVTVVNQSTTVDGTLSLFLNGTGANDRLFRRLIPAGTDLQLDPWWAFHAGDVLKATRVTSDMTVSTYGYDLVL